LSPGALTIGGNLSFETGAAYTVQIGSTGFGRQRGPARDDQRRRDAQRDFLAGVTFVQKYKILTAGGGLTGAFASWNIVGGGALKDTVSYDAHDAYLTLSIDPTLAGATNRNQTAVADAVPTG